MRILDSEALFWTLVAALVMALAIMLMLNQCQGPQEFEDVTMPTNSEETTETKKEPPPPAKPEETALPPSGGIKLWVG